MTIRRSATLQITLWLWLLILAGFPLGGRGQAQPDSLQKGARLGSATAADAGERTFPALLISDIHFDPFHDPAKVRRLAEASASQWGSILSDADSADHAEAFAGLQQSCHARGVDTPFILLRSSLEAMWQQRPDAKFMMVSGDLIAHSFSCKYRTMFPGAKASEYEDFVLKTMSFVTGELRARFPGMAIYVSLGNNDSACGDYRLDAGSDFLAQTAKIVAEGLPATLSPAQRRRAIEEFASGGYYSVTMAGPMQKTRLIVINDVFMSPRYSTCAGKADAAATTEEMAWLQRQLSDARRLGQRVWVLGHIPPGVDPYATVAKFTDVCGVRPPAMFLSSDKLAELLINYGDVIRLGIFGHTHMDEMRLLPAKGGGTGVAIKIVASISPVHGNNPSFTVARIGQSSALLRDYAVIAASNQSGVASTWSREYEYAQSYHEAQFSPATVKKLIGQFENDRGAKTAVSQEYIRDYVVGDKSSELEPFWPLYVCSLENYTAKAFAACVCPAGK